MNTNIDEINNKLDQISDRKFNSVQDAWQAIALELEKNGIQVPDIDNFEDEMRFKLYLDDELQPHYLYINFDTDDDDVNEETSKTITYATFLDPEESDLLDNMNNGKDDEEDDSSDIRAHHQRIRKMTDY